MAFTRFNYDKDRYERILHESTGAGRYHLNVPGPAHTHKVFDDPQIRLQKFAGNNRTVVMGHPIDIDNDLTGRTRKLSKYCANKKFPYKGVQNSIPTFYKKESRPITDQSRVTHPSHLYRDLEQNHKHPLHFDPQQHTCLKFQNNLNTRLLERDSHVPKIPVLLEDN
tara:strand:+ start:164 stop:664 length:501 start_codon:yes stop_codon:yes gene_type:complete